MTRSLLRFLFAPSILLLLGLAIAQVAGCADDDDLTGGPTLPPSTDCPPCPAGRTCVLQDGVSLCLAPNCGDAVCAEGAACVDGQCQFVDRVCNPECDSGQICVYGNCITEYSTTNVCDPWQECERRCVRPTGGVDAVCLAACETSRSGTCLGCLDQLQTCESRENCVGSATDCCPERFCACFPENPGCSDTPCDICYRESDDSATFQACINDTPACSSCLQPFSTCRDAGGSTADCIDELCLCLSPSVEPSCAD